MNYQPKTDRKRGVIYGLILYTSRIARQFTADNLTPALDRDQARKNCCALVKLSELRIVRAGTPGHNGRATIYARARCGCFGLRASSEHRQKVCSNLK